MKVINGLKEAALSSMLTMKGLAKGEAHLQDYMVVGCFFVAGFTLGCLL